MDYMCYWSLLDFTAPQQHLTYSCNVSSISPHDVHLFTAAFLKHTLLVCDYNPFALAYTHSVIKTDFGTFEPTFALERLRRTRNIFQTLFSLCSSIAASSTKPCQVQCGNDKHPLYPSSEMPVVLSHNEAPTFQFQTVLLWAGLIKNSTKPMLAVAMSTLLTSLLEQH